MKKKETKKLIADQDEIGDYRKEYDTYDALCEELGIKLPIVLLQIDYVKTCKTAKNPYRY